MKISIITEAGGDVGLGHVVRMGHLYNVLKQRGNNVAVWANEAGCLYFTSVNIPSFVYTAKERLAPESDIVIVDFMNNDDDYLTLLRPRAQKLVVVVGVGWTITPTTRWIADLVVYHTPQDGALYDWTPGEKILQGLEYIMMDPNFADVKINDERQYDIVTYFGGGLNPRIEPELLRRLDEKYNVCALGEDGQHWNSSPYDVLSDSKLYIGSMGMMTYEAIVCRAYPMVLCRSEDHIESAERLANRDLAANFGLFSRSKAEVSIDVMITAIRKKLDVVRTTWTPIAYETRKLDGKGIYRVALEILND